MRNDVRRWAASAAVLTMGVVPCGAAGAAPSQPVAPAPIPTSPSVGEAVSAWRWPGKVDSDLVRQAASSPVVAALKAEMERAMSGLQLPQRQPPYYVAYTLLDVEQRLVVGQLGTVIQSQHHRGRTLHPEVRVGSPTLDNSYAGVEGGMGVESFGQALVLDDDETALRTAIWTATDGAYRAATAALEQKTTQRAGEREFEARPFDFATEEPHQTVIADLPALPESAQLERLVSAVSKAFLAFPEVHESVVTAAAWSIRRTLLTSEGTLAITPTRVVEITIECNTQADDGMPLSHEVTLFGQLEEESLRKAAERLATELTELRRAPIAPDYYGPVLFSGVAAPQIVQELLANSVVGTPVPSEGPWARRLQRRVLPASVDLVDDPTLERLHNVQLLGNYVVDDEGVPAQKVSLVERGVLRDLLMSRTPSRDVKASNGHGRTGYASWARGAVGNLILSTRTPTPVARQKRQLLSEGQNALEIERFSPREFATNGGAPPTVERAYLVAPDGKRTLVRGVTLSEMPVRDLKDVISVGSEPTVYSALQSAGGYSIPTSFVSPALLFEEVEAKKPKESPALPKFLPRELPKAP
jgi:TldD protein